MFKPKTICLPDPIEVDQAKIATRALSGHANADHVRLSLEDGSGESEELVLSGQLVRMLLKILSETSEGNAVSLISHKRELSTQSAARLLNVSHLFLIGILEKGEIPYHKAGSHQSLLLADVMAYKEKTEQLRTQALDELALLSQQVLKDY